MNKKSLLIFLAMIFLSFKAFGTSCGSIVCTNGQLYYSNNITSGMSCPKCVSTCPPGTFATFNTMRGPSCDSSFNSTTHDCYQCQQQNYQYLRPNPYHSPQMPWMVNPYTPWWAIQGNFYYPNFQYPGAWHNNGIYTNHYPGNHGGIALKPNIYVKNDKVQPTNFSWNFIEREKAQFLATTPALKNYGWEGIVSGESFRVNNVGYSYLFYDARMDHEKMQFSGGICLEKVNLVPEMMMDLKKKGYPEVALKDFNEHWTIKIPDYPYYCIYPQYTEQLNVLMPIKVTPSDAVITRVLFVLVPHLVAPKIIAKRFPALPTRTPVSIENVESKTNDKPIQFLEWGVAFLDEKVITQ